MRFSTSSIVFAARMPNNLVKKLAKVLCVQFQNTNCVVLFASFLRIHVLFSMYINFACFIITKRPHRLYVLHVACCYRCRSVVCCVPACVSVLGIGQLCKNR